MKLKKYLGQYFLKNHKILKFLVNSLGKIENKTVIEIGSGHGELTKFLYKKCILIAYEIDKGLAEYLKRKFPKAKIINRDFLKANLEKFNHKYYIIGNIPYYLSKKILEKILNIKNFPQKAILTFQKEYGEKILGIPYENFLSIWIKNWCKTKKLIFIKKKFFYPQPKVDSISILFEFYKKPKICNVDKFKEFLKYLFKNPKKTVYNNLKNLIKDLKIDKKIRPHQLKFENIIKLFKKYEKNN